MKWNRCITSLIIFLTTLIPAAPAQRGTSPNAADDPITVLVKRLDLEQYKATIKGLTQFGDRRQGTDRNRAAIAWIEAQLRRYGCTNTERLKYDYPPSTPNQPSGSSGPVRTRGYRIPTGVNTDPLKQP